MIPVLLIAIGSLLALSAVLLLAKGRLRAGENGKNLDGRLCPIDVDAFRNLMDESEEEFLREHLPPPEFRAIHRERMLAASEYVRGAARNAGLLIQLAEAARLNPDPAVAAVAEGLQENAFRLRLYAWQTLPRLYVSVVIPGARLAPQTLAEKYDSLTRQMVTLNCLQSPARISNTV